MPASVASCGQKALGHRSCKTYQRIGSPGKTDSSDAKRTTLPLRPVHSLYPLPIYNVFTNNRFVNVLFFTRYSHEFMSLNNIPTLPRSIRHFLHARPKSKIMFRPTVSPAHVIFEHSYFFNINAI